ncbi:hypothetical protein Bca4012_008799 [Brassica carinata]
MSNWPSSLNRPVYFWIFFWFPTYELKETMEPSNESEKRRQLPLNSSCLPRGDPSYWLVNLIFLPNYISEATLTTIITCALLIRIVTFFML